MCWCVLEHASARSHVLWIPYLEMTHVYGAAIHIGLNCYGVLKRWDLQVEDIQGVKLLGLNKYKSNGEQTFAIELQRGAGQ